jgi:hypothetical protein
MAIQLTTNIVIGNGARLLLSLRPDEDALAASVTAELRTSVANGDVVLASKTFTLRNGPCDVIRKRPSVAAGSFVGEVLEVVGNGITLPAGYDNAVAAYYGAAKVGRKAALEQHGLAAGWIDATLTGT